MTEDHANPFAAPQSEPTAGAEELPELHGKMPASVMLAVGGCGVIVALNALSIAITAMGAVNAYELLVLGIPLALGVAVLIGLLSRSRLARQWGRLFSLLGAVLASLLLAISLFSFGVMFSDSLYADGVGDSSGSFVVLIVASMLFQTLPAILLWSIFLSLGRPTAYQWFNLICPACHSRRTKAANFMFTKAKCKQCNYVW